MESRQGVWDKWNIVLYGMVLLSVLAAVTKLFVGFDIDEAYAVTMPYRLCQGDRLFLDMWEVHQTSSFLPYLFIRLFTAVTGDIEYLVLFLRAAASLIHFVLTIFVFRTLRTCYDSHKALFFSLVYYNFLPKWMMNLDFSMQLLWFMTISLLFLFYGIRHNRAGMYFLCGIGLAFAVLAYPGMVFMYPFYLGMIWISEQNIKAKINKCVVLTLGCFVTAVCFFSYILSYMGPAELIQSIPMVFSDGSHQFSFAAKAGLFVRRWIEVIVQAGILLFPCQLINMIYGKVTGKKADLVSFCQFFLTVSSGIVVTANIFGILWGPFRIQVRYIILFVLSFLLCRSLKKKQAYSDKERGIFCLLVLPSIGMFFGVLAASNVGPASSASYLVPANLGFLLLFDSAVHEKCQKAGDGKNKNPCYALANGALFLFLLSLIMCKGYYVRVTEYAPSNILEPRRQVEEGAAKGIFVTEEDYARITDNYDIIMESSQDGEKILFMGTESLNNLTPPSEGRSFVSPTTISTPAFNMQWTIYFSQHPDKKPNVIYIAKNTVDNRRKLFAENDFGRWIAAHYDVEHMVETEYLCIIRPRAE